MNEKITYEVFQAIHGSKKPHQLLKLAFDWCNLAHFIKEKSEKLESDNNNLATLNDELVSVLETHGITYESCLASLVKNRAHSISLATETLRQGMIKNAELAQAEKMTENGKRGGEQKKLNNPKSPDYLTIENEFLKVKNSFNKRGNTTNFNIDMQSKVDLSESRIQRITQELKKKYL